VPEYSVISEDHNTNPSLFNNRANYKWQYSQKRTLMLSCMVSEPRGCGQRTCCRKSK